MYLKFPVVSRSGSLNSYGLLIGMLKLFNLMFPIDLMNDECLRRYGKVMLMWQNDFLQCGSEDCNQNGTRYVC